MGGVRGPAGVAIVLATFGPLAGCYSPSAAVGVPCSATGECPADQRCDLSASPPTCVDGDTVPPAPDAAVPADPACRADTDCTDGVCVEHLGTCVDESNVLYVAATGADTGTCTASAPCATLGHALDLVANNKRTIAIADGTYTEPVEIDAFGANSLTISGPVRDPTGVTLANGFVLAGGTNDVVIEGVTIANPGGRAVENHGTLALSRVRLTGSTIGLYSTNQNELRVADSTIDGNTGLGVDLAQTTLELARTHVVANGGGGIQITNAATTIESSIVAGNGGLLSAVGGVRYQNVNGLPQIFRFNTVADNQAGLVPAGVMCPTPVTLDNSIVVGPMMFPLLAPACEPRYCLFAINPPPGTGNREGDPAFVGGGDYHIAPRSVARDAADPAATVERDVDGDVRPQGSGRDIGADETL